MNAISIDETAEIEKLKRRLGLSESDAQDDLILRDLWQEWLSAALSASNRTGEAACPPPLLAIVRDLACASYLRRGDEGSQSVSLGGVSTQYDDLHAQLLRRILQANLRVYRR